MASQRRNDHTQLSTLLLVGEPGPPTALLRDQLAALGYQVMFMPPAGHLAAALSTSQPDLIVIASAEPLVVCQQLRQLSTLPAVIVSAAHRPADTVAGFAAGADDYIGQPYDPAELAARVAAVLRRVHRQFTPAGPLQFGPLQVNLAERQVTISGQPLQLSRTEYRLLEYFVLNAGRTLPAETLLRHVWGSEYAGDHASLHLYVSRLRRKLGEDAQAPRLIVTKPGVGYFMSPPDNQNLLERSR